MQQGKNSPIPPEEYTQPIESDNVATKYEENFTKPPVLVFEEINPDEIIADVVGESLTSKLSSLDGKIKFVELENNNHEFPVQNLFVFSNLKGFNYS